MKLTQIKSVIYHNKGYLIRYVKNPVKSGYFLEALCRLDSLIDSMIINLLLAAHPENEGLLGYLESHKAFIPIKVAHLLKEQEIIEYNLIKKIKKFKDCRNMVVHKPHGDLDLAIKETHFHETQGICHDCEGCFADHLKSLGFTDLNEYAISVLKKKVEEGIEIYAKLEKTLKIAEKLRKKKDKKLEQRFKKKRNYRA